MFVVISCKYLPHRSGLSAWLKYQDYYSFIRFVYYLLVLDLLLIILTTHTVKGVLDSMQKCAVVRPCLGETTAEKWRAIHASLAAMMTSIYCHILQVFCRFSFRYISKRNYIYIYICVCVCVCIYIYSIFRKFLNLIVSCSETGMTSKKLKAIHAQEY